MRTIDIVLETLAHFVKMEGGPPPGIPVRVEPDFERKLVRLCEWHSLAPLFLDSLQKLALESPLSDVTLERLNSLSRASAERNEKYIAALRSISARLRERRVPFLLIDDMMAALKLYPRHRLRPIERLDVLIHENDWDMFVSGLRAVGYRREERDPTFEDGREAMLYHQYFSPCVLHGERDVEIGVKFRLIDVGHPAAKEAAWTMGKRLGRDVEAMRLSYEDQYVRSCMAFNMTGFGRLLHAVDAGRILARHGEDLDWGYIEGRARGGSYYPALFFAHETIVKMFQFQAKRKPLSDPGAVQKSFFQMVWSPGRLGAFTDRPPTLHRYRFSFFAHGTWGDRMKVAGSLIAPRKDWVSGYFGRTSNPWLAFKFTSLALRNKLSEPQAKGEKPRAEAKPGRESAGAETRPIRSGPREGSSREGSSRDGRPRDGQRRDSRQRRDFSREGSSRDGRPRRGGPPPRRPRQSPDDRPPETRPAREYGGRSERPDGRDYRRDGRREPRRDDRREDKREEPRDERREDKREEPRDGRREDRRDDRRDDRPVRQPEPSSEDRAVREGAAQEPRPQRGRRRRWTSSSRRGPEDRARRGPDRRGDRADRPDETSAPKSEPEGSADRGARHEETGAPQGNHGGPAENTGAPTREPARTDDRGSRTDAPTPQGDDRAPRPDDAGGRREDSRRDDAGGRHEDSRQDDTGGRRDDARTDDAGAGRDEGRREDTGAAPDDTR
ncbi:MAG: putative nucleotidyltransferase [Candidatus Krumholzibacteriota bacterium]|nr:putative nucleotidyltransferase [Candidatus Krumholzibacteriota bacterium]